MRLSDHKRSLMLPGVVLAAAILGVFAMIACRVGPFKESTAQDNVSTCGQLMVRKEQLYLGTLPPVSGFDVVLLVTNLSSKDVRVTNVHASCACTHVSPRAFSIPAHGTVDLRVTLDLTNFSVAGVGTNNPFSVTLLPMVEQGASAELTPWRLTGNVQNALTVRTLSNTLDRTELVEELPTVVIMATCSHPSADVSVSGGEDMLNWSVNTLDRNSWELMGSFREPLVLDESVTLPVEIVAKVSRTIVGIRRLTVSGRTGGWVRVTPRNLHLSSSIGVKPTDVISVQSKQGHVFDLEATIEGLHRGEFDVAIVTEGPFVQKILVTAHASTVGLKEAMLMIRLRVPSGGVDALERQLEVPLTSHVVAHDILSFAGKPEQRRQATCGSKGSCGAQSPGSRRN